MLIEPTWHCQKILNAAINNTYYWDVFSTSLIKYWSLAFFKRIFRMTGRPIRHLSWCLHVCYMCLLAQKSKLVINLIKMSIDEAISLLIYEQLLFDWNVHTLWQHILRNMFNMQGNWSLCNNAAINIFHILWPLVLQHTIFLLQKWRQKTLLYDTSTNQALVGNKLRFNWENGGRNCRRCGKGYFHFAVTEV